MTLDCLSQELGVPSEGPAVDPDYSDYGGRKDKMEPNSTGFFQVQKLEDDRWTFVDPDGYHFLSVGINSVGVNSQQKLFQSGFEAQFNNSFEMWAESTQGMLRGIGVNTLGSWSSDEHFQRPGTRMPYCPRWNFMLSYKNNRRGGGYYDIWRQPMPVFDPEFETFAMENAKQLAAYKDDPWVLGHFSDNEMPFHANNLLHRYLEMPPDDPNFIAAQAWIDDHNKTVGTLTQTDHDAFCIVMVERYYSVVSSAMKTYDPNHLFIGSRVHGRVSSEACSYIAASKYVDVVTVNYYHRWTPQQERIYKWARLSGRPVMITEFYAKGDDALTPPGEDTPIVIDNIAGSGFTVPTQADRGEFYQQFTLNLLRNRNVIGWHWHKYTDWSANTGIVDRHFLPYQDCVNGMARVNKQVYSLSDFLWSNAQRTDIFLDEPTLVLPSQSPSQIPSEVPSLLSPPTKVPTATPFTSSKPSDTPTNNPSEVPTTSPSPLPTSLPTTQPSTSTSPSAAPTDSPAFLCPKITESKGKQTDTNWARYKSMTLDCLSQELGVPNEETKDPDYSDYGGRLDKVEENSTGFFQIKKLEDDRWTFVDPDGYHFLSVGINSVGVKTQYEFFRSGFEAQFNNSFDIWAESTHHLLQSVGINTLGSWSSYQHFQRPGVRIPYCPQWNFLLTYKDNRHGGSYDIWRQPLPVFDPEFEAFALDHARQLAAYKDDPWIIGHFSDHQVPFHANNLLHRYLEMPSNDPNYQAAQSWIDDHNKTVGTLTQNDHDAFCIVMVERYYRVVYNAMKTHDPNHLFIGSRVHGKVSSEECSYIASSKYVDVVTVNYYHRWTPEQSRIYKWAQLSGKPIMLTEWYAKGNDAISPPDEDTPMKLTNIAGHGFTVPTQADRGEFYQQFTLNLLRNRNVIGWHWHQYTDWSYNSGIVNRHFLPYQDCVDGMARVNKQVYSLSDFLWNNSEETDLFLDRPTLVE